MNTALPRELTRALVQLSRSNGRDGLDSAYGRLPSTTCQRHGHCCGLLPPVQSVELLVWLLEFSALPQDEMTAEARCLVEHFLFNAAQRRQCPWLEPGRCAVYRRRFFGCRAYGLWSMKAYEQRRAASVAGAEQIVIAWRSLGVELSTTVLAPGPDYCRCVEPCPGQEGVDDAGLEQLEENLAAMADNLPGAAIFGQWGGDIAYALAWLALGQQAALSLKVDITKAVLGGQPAAAQGLLAEAMSRTDLWVNSIFH